MSLLRGIIGPKWGSLSRTKARVSARRAAELGYKEGSLSRTTAGAAGAAGSGTVGVTEYKVLNDGFVEGITPSKDGSVTVIIRRGSLNLPAPESVGTLVREDVALV